MINVGDRFFVVSQNTSRRDNIREYRTVTRVGRIYFYLEGLREQRFYISTTEEADPGYYYYKLYRTEEEFLLELEAEKIRDWIETFVRDRINPLSLNQLKQIKSIIESSDRPTTTEPIDERDPREIMGFERVEVMPPRQTN